MSMAWVQRLASRRPSGLCGSRTFARGGADGRKGHVEMRFAIMLGLLSAAQANLPAGYCDLTAVELLPEPVNVTAAVRAERSEGNFLMKTLKSGTTNLAGFDQATIQPYLTTVLMATIAFAAIGVLACIAFPYLCCARLCCLTKCGCCRADPLKGAPFVGRAKHTLAYAIFAVFALIAAAKGFEYVFGFNLGVSLFGCEIFSLFENAKTFLDTITDPLDDLAKVINDKLNDIIALVGEADEIAILGEVETALTAYKTAVDGLSSITANASLPTGPDTSGPQTTLLAAHTSAAAATAIIRTVTETLTGLEDDLVNAFKVPKDTLKSVTDQAKEQTGVLKSRLDGLKARATNYVTTYVLEFQNYFVGGGSSGFGISVVATIIGTVGVVMLMRCPTRKSSLRVVNSGFVLSWLFAIFGCLLGGILFAPSYLVSDVCEVLYDFGTAPRPYTAAFFGDGDSVISDVLEGCLLLPSVPVVESLKITSNFGDATALDFSSLDKIDLDSDVDFTSLDAVVDVANSVDWKDFNMETVDADARAQCETDGGTYQAGGCGLQEFENVQALNETINTQMADIQSKAETIKSKGATLNTALDTLYDKLTQAKGLVQPIFNAINKLDEAGDCAFLRARFWGLYYATCDVLLSSLFWLSIALAGGGVISVVLGSLLLMVAKQIILALSYNLIDHAHKLDAMADGAYVAAEDGEGAGDVPTADELSTTDRSA